MLNCLVETPMVYQDITLVISLVTVGGVKVKTKHMRVRMHLAMEGITEIRIVVKYIPTLSMITNGFTKTLDGSDF
jgi:hypothetical protein